MKNPKYPKGWNEERIQRVIAGYESQSEEDAALEDETGVAPAETVMSIPRELVAKVREMIAKREQ